MPEQLSESPKKALQTLVRGHKKLIVAMMLCMAIPLLIQIAIFIQHWQQYNSLMKAIAIGPVDNDQQQQIPMEKVSHLLSRSTYQGQWQASIKRSEYLEAEKGLLEITTTRIQAQTLRKRQTTISSADQITLGGKQTKQTTQKGQDFYRLHIRIYDGQYRDQGFYDISIEIKPNNLVQRFEPGELLFVTNDPLIGVCRQGYRMHLQKQDTLYINQIKLKVKARSEDIIYSSDPSDKIESRPSPDDISLSSSSVRIQFLLSSEYSINIVSKQIKEHSELTSLLPFSVVVILQFMLQTFGILQIYKNICKEKQCSSRYSLVGFITATGLSVIEGIGLLLISIEDQMKFALLLPTVLISWTSIIFLQVKVLILINQKRHEQRQNTNWFTVKVYAIFILMVFLSYELNASPVFFVGASLLVMVPQIIRNYLVGHKLKKSMIFFMYYSLPRYWLIPYLRLYKYNALHLQPQITLSIVCLALIISQISLISVQIKYGVRSILPRILHPNEFKYFMSQPEPQDNTCSICITSLNERSPENKQQSQDRMAAHMIGSMQAKETQEIGMTEQQRETIQNHRNQQQLQQRELFNNVVLTPCGHKFHIECLVRWMNSRLQCPNCRTILPPIEDYK